MSLMILLLLWLLWVLYNIYSQMRHRVSVNGAKVTREVDCRGSPLGSHPQFRIFGQKNRDWAAKLC